MVMRSISIIGTGNIGYALAKKWIPRGYSITFGVRDMKSPKAVNASELRAEMVSVNEAIAKNDIVVLAVPASAVESVVKGYTKWGSKIIIDTTNPISFPVPEGFKSLAEAVASWAGSTHVVKAFNSTGAANLVNPDYNDIAIDTFICGDDQQDKVIVEQLAYELGLNVVDVGALVNSDLLENLANFGLPLPIASRWVRILHLNY